MVGGGRGGDWMGPNLDGPYTWKISMILSQPAKLPEKITKTQKKSYIFFCENLGPLKSVEILLSE